MKVFVSWSEARSRRVGKALEVWLPQVIQSVEPFVSTEMDAGIRWNAVVEQQLSEHDIGILCVTPENVGRPWLNYEAGALAHRLNDKARLIPYLLDFATPNDLGAPLNQFNVVLADQEGTWKLIKTLDGLNERPRAVGELKEVFDAYWWPRLEAELEEIKSDEGQAAPPRPDGEKLDELLEISRQLLRRGDGPNPGAWVSRTTFGEARADRTSLRLRSPSDPTPLKVIDPSGLGRVALEGARWLQRQGYLEIEGDDSLATNESDDDSPRRGQG